MSVTPGTVNSSDTLNQGRVKWNDNDAALAAQGNALEVQQAAHVITGHSALYYLKAEVLALIANLYTITAGRILGTGTGKAVDGSSIGLNVSNELELMDDGVGLRNIPDGLLTLAKLAQKFYFAKASQTGTNNPSVTVLANTLGFTPTWTRANTGYYLSSSHDAFQEGKTFCLICPSFAALGSASIFTNDAGVGTRPLGIYSCDTAHAPADGILSSTWILVIVLP
jgi:hypothetical protein